MPTDLTQDVKELFKNAPPPRRELFSQWHEYDATEELPEILEPRQEQQEQQPEPVLRVPTVLVPVTNQNARRKYDNETRNLRRMAVLRCLESGMTDRKKIGKKLGLPAGTVFHDIMYWRKQPK